MNRRLLLALPVGLLALSGKARAQLGALTAPHLLALAVHDSAAS